MTGGRAPLNKPIDTTGRERPKRAPRGEGFLRAWGMKHLLLLPFKDRER